MSNLDPWLPDGKKLPKWSPCSQKVSFMVYSLHHFSIGSLVFYLQPGLVS